MGEERNCKQVPVERLQHFERALWPIVESKYEARLSRWQRAYLQFLKVIRPINYPLKHAVEAWKSVSQFGQIIEDEENIPRWQQLLHQLILYGRYGLPPISYYTFRLFRKDRRDEAGFYIHHKQMDVLMKGVIAIAGAEDDAVLLENKSEFFNHCRRHGIPTVSVLLAFEEGEVTPCDLQPNQSLPRIDLFSKPIEGGQGRGAQCWTYKNNNVYQAADGTALTGKELKDLLTHRSSSRGFLLQKRLRNHPRLEALAGGTLCTARIVTGRRLDGVAQPLISTLRLSVEGAVTDNFSTGSIGAPIHGSTGRLGTGHCRDVRTARDRIERHPSTGKSIVGFELPHWQDALRLVKQAHDSLPRLPFVGWDIAFTGDGPIVVEGNAVFGADVLQIPHERPLGCTHFMKYYNDCFNGKA